MAGTDRLSRWEDAIRTQGGDTYRLRASPDGIGIRWQAAAAALSPPAASLLKDALLSIGVDLETPSGEQVSYASEQFEWHGERVHETSVFTAVSDQAGVQVQIRLRSLEAEALRLDVTVSNLGDALITGLVCPRLDRFSLAEDDFAFTWPFRSGVNVPVSALEAGRSLILTYPVYGSMQWIDLYRADGGLYLGAHDPLPYFKMFYIGKEGDAPFVAIRFPGVDIKPGETWAVPPICMALHEGDWHTGAKIYRRWAEDAWFTPMPRPAWQEQKASWNVLVTRDQMAPQPDHQFSDLPRLSALTDQKYNVSMLHVAGYMEYGHDTNYPDYSAGPAMGGEEAFKESIRAIHQAGRRVCVYLNGRWITDIPGYERKVFDWAVKAGRGRDLFHEIWAEILPGYDDAEEMWDPRAVCLEEPTGWDPENRAVKEQWGVVTTGVMCPSVPAWQETFTHWVLYLIRQYDVDGCQFDQVCGCWPYLCYDESHPHLRPNEAWSHYKAFMANVRSWMKSVKRDTFLWSEGINDILGMSFDGLQDDDIGGKRNIMFKGRGTPLPELFRYTFPEHLIYYAIRADTWKDLLYTFVSGGGYHLHLNVEHEGDPQYVALLKKCMAWYEAYHDYYLHGKVLPAPTAMSPDLTLFHYYKDGCSVITGAWIPEDRDQAEPPTTLRFSIRQTDGMPPVRMPVLVAMETVAGEAQPLSVSTVGDRLEIEVGFEEAFVLRIVWEMGN